MWWHLCWKPGFLAWSSLFPPYARHTPLTGLPDHGRTRDPEPPLDLEIRLCPMPLAPKICNWTPSPPPAPQSPAPFQSLPAASSSVIRSCFPPQTPPLFQGMGVGWGMCQRLLRVCIGPQKTLPVFENSPTPSPSQWLHSPKEPLAEAIMNS